MANLAVWLMGIAGPIVKKVLFMLGIGVITYASITGLIDGVVQQAQDNWGQVGGATMQILTLAGIPDVLGIIAGALTARASFIILKKLGSVQAS